MTKTYKYDQRVQLSDHFGSHEFKCKCGKAHDYKVDEALITRLEALYDELGCSSIVITSGFRCPEHSVSVGGYATDGHTKGIAADVNCYVGGELANPYDVAAAAERVGFSGIGLMSSNCHVDVRTKENYRNDHWFGNEVTGDDNIKTFQNLSNSSKKPDSNTSDVTKKGIDVSYAQANIDFDTVKSHIDFAIIRAGFGREYDQVDSKFERNYSGFKKAGVPVGAYWYSYALTPAEIKKEAEVFLATIKGKQFEYPVFLDLEEADQFKTGKSNVSAMIKAFCDVMEKAGYFVGLYTNTSTLLNYITDDVKARYALWVADWRGYCGYTGTKVMWQMGTKSVLGVLTGPVDYDYCYADFSVIKKKGFNGFKAGETKPVKPETPKNEEVNKPTKPDVTKPTTQEEVLKEILKQVTEINQKL